MSDEAAEIEAPPAPAKKRKKDRRAPEAPPIEEGEVGAHQGSTGGTPPRGEVPAFALGFPPDGELDRLVAAFAHGNYAAVREGAARLAKDAPDEAVRRAAGELLRRLDPDPLAVLLVLAACGLLVFLSVWYWVHAHAADGGHRPQ